MEKRRLNPERVVSVVGFCFLLIAAIISLILDGDRNSILEKVADTSILIPCVHFFCVAWCFIMLFKPSDVSFIGIVTIESVLTILTNYDQLGIFFFYSSIMLIMCKGFTSRRGTPKLLIGILTFLHILALLGTYPHGWAKTVIAFSSSVFSCVFYIWVYYILKAKLSCFIPRNVSNNDVIIKKQPGSVINLEEYGLNERQKTFVIENLHNNLSYKDISEKYNVSVSLVKKVFSEVYKIFNVSKLEELRILLLQYQIKG